MTSPASSTATPTTSSSTTSATTRTRIHVGEAAAVETLLAVEAKAPRSLLAVDAVMAGPGTAAVLVRESILVDGVAHEIRRLLRYRIVGERFSECWLYEEAQSLVDRAWA